MDGRNREGPKIVAKQGGTVPMEKKSAPSEPFWGILDNEVRGVTYGRVTL